MEPDRFDLALRYAKNSTAFERTIGLERALMLSAIKRGDAQMAAVYAFNTVQALHILRAV